MCPFGLRSELIKEIESVLHPPLSHEAARTLKYLKGISVKNGYRVVTVGSSGKSYYSRPPQPCDSDVI